MKLLLSADFATFWDSFVRGSFSKMYFRRRPPDQQPLAFKETPRTNLEVQGPFGDDVTFQECRKSLKFKISQFRATRSGGTGSQTVAGGVSAHFRLVKTPSIAIWGQQNQVFHENQVFSRFTNKCLDSWELGKVQKAPKHGAGWKLVHVWWMQVQRESLLRGPAV